ncbi:SRPBCC family protein [Aeromicrobium sp. CF3.5]|uniref:SRPBCC family protein n=1 Tax=Aeromicrobium sp. CF3.5 TaxID=3373078 RepID=UPI003EE43CD8
MTWFTAERESTAVVAADRAAIWAILTDPDVLARLTPLLERIEASGDHWVWHLKTIEVLSERLVPTFTEKMTFDEGSRIEFTHDPPAGSSERAGVEGRYDLVDVDGGTQVSIRLEISVDLPLPKMTSPAVTTAMKAVIASMGNGFAKRLNAELGV